MANIGNTVVNGKLTVSGSAVVNGNTVVTANQLATVATSGSYNDLTNKPTIDNNNQTITSNGTAFGANAAIKLVSGSNITLTPDTTNNTITLASSYTNTTYSAGTGITLSGTTFSANTTYFNDNYVPSTRTIAGVELSADITKDKLISALGLSQAMKFIGTTTTALSDGSTTAEITIGSDSVTAVSGNIAIYGSKEFIFNGSTWEELGDESQHSLSLTSGGESPISLAANTAYTLKVGDKSVVFKTPTDTDTHYTNSLIIQGAGTTATTFTQNANKTLNIKGSGATSVSAADGVITINSTDTNTWRGIQDNLTSTSTTDSLSAKQGYLLNNNKVEKFSAGGIASCDGGGEYNYFKIATIKITSAGINRPIVFKISGRGYKLSEVTVMFTSTSSTDPDLNLFDSSEGTNYWIVKSKTETSTWVLYGGYSAADGSAVLHQITGSGANIGVTVNMENAASVPDGAVQAKNAYSKVGHTHTWTDISKRITSGSVSYIPISSASFTGTTGTATGSFTPKGTVSVTPSTNSDILTLKSAGTLPSFTQGAFSAGSVAMAASDGGLFITYTAPTHGDDTLEQGAMPTFNTTKVVTGISSTSFTGTEGTVSTSFTPSGNVSLTNGDATKLAVTFGYSSY